MPEGSINICHSDAPVNHEKLLKSFQEMQIAYIEAVFFSEELSKYEAEKVIQQVKERLCRGEK